MTTDTAETFPTDRTAYERVRRRLRARFRSRTFPFGYGGYEPFTSLDPHAHGPLFDLMFRFADELHCKAVPVLCTWQDFPERVGTRQILTMADPIMPSIGRPFDVVPYVRITANTLLYAARQAGPVAKQLAPLPGLIRQMSRRQLRHDETGFARRYSTFRAHLTELARIGQGFAVMKGNVDDNTLSLFEITVGKRYTGRDVATAALDGLSRNYLFLTDMASATMAMDRLPNTQRRRYAVAHLFGNDFPCRQVAGFPVSRLDPDLKDFFYYHGHADEGFVSDAIARLDPTVLTRYGLSALAHDEIDTYMAVPRGPLTWSGVAGIGLNTLKATRRVFINYAREDRARARSLCHRLTQAAFNPWLDAFDLLGGQHWERELKRAMREATIVLLCLSRKSTRKRGFVQKEIQWATEIAKEIPDGKAYLLPVLLEPCEVPSQLSGIQYIPLYEPGGFDKLVRSLELHIVEE